MTEDLRVASYNIHGGIGMDERLDLHRIGDVIRRLDADVVGLQEVYRHHGPPTAFADQIRVLSDYLDMEYAYGEALRKDPAPASDDNPQRYGIATLSNHPIESVEQHELAREPDNEQRIFLKTVVSASDTPIRIYNTHLETSRRARATQIDEVLNIADQHAEPTVLVGDFNLEPGSTQYAALTAKFTDAFESVGLENAYTAPSPYVDHRPNHGYVQEYIKVYRPRRRVDYVFAGENCSVQHAELRHSIASDHSPILADVTFQRSRRTGDYN